MLLKFGHLCPEIYNFWPDIHQSVTVLFKTYILARFQPPNTIFDDVITSQKTLGPPNKSDNSKKRQSKAGYK